jgi:hypothetical protein
VKQFDATVQWLRRLHRMLIVAILLYPYAGEKAGLPGPKDVSMIQQVLLLAALLTLGSLVVVRRKMVQSGQQALRLRPDDIEALVRWRMGNIASFVLCEAVALYGFVLRFLGGTLLQAAPFYVCALLLMLLFIPRRP